MCAQPLAQEYVTVYQVPSPDLITGGGALLRLPSGDLLASYFLLGVGPESGRYSNDTPDALRLSISGDDGQTWLELPPINVYDGFPFQHEGAVYMVMHGHGRKNITVSRSDDECRTWSDPVTVLEGLFWNCPHGEVVRNGQLYRAFGTTGPDGMYDHIVAAACDLAKGPLDPAAWRVSNPVGYPGTPDELEAGVFPPGSTDWTFRGHWLEPNVVNVGGHLQVLARCRIDGYGTSSIAGVCDLADGGDSLGLTFRQFYPIPGAQQRFHVIYDEVSRLFWAPVNLVTDSQDTQGIGKKLQQMGFKGTPGNERRILMLNYSLDALNWFQAGCVAMYPSHLQSFHYAAPLIDGDDLLILVRTSRDAPNQHDSELMTFHRVRDFRSLALDLHAEV